jgi:hypothetical protein
VIAMSENRTHFLRLIGQPPGAKGRATKYDPDVHCQMVRDMAEEGEFPEAWASAIGVTVAQMRLWVHQHEEFRESVIIAHQLLITYWTRQIALHRNTEGAKPGMYQMIMRRFPTIYGKNPIDLQAWLMEPPPAPDAPGAQALTTEAVKAATDDDLQARLEVLRRRRQEEQG